MGTLRFNGKQALFLYDAAAADGDEASRDVFDQLDALETALQRHGMATARCGVDLDLGALRRRIDDSHPDVIVNLVESVDGSDRLQTLVPLLLEDRGIPFTGSGSATMLLSNDKIASKRSLAVLGLPVPDALWRTAGGPALHSSARFPGGRGDWIVKAAYSHASLYLNDDSVMLNASPEAVAARVAEESRKRGIRFFAERFVHGREFNISLLERPDGSATVFPAAEIRFDSLPADRMRIVGYAAKWAENTDEFSGTVRHFDFAEHDAELIETLREYARRVWEGMALRGYARVDFRVDGAGAPYVLEVNVNPCLTPDAGFAAAAGQGGLSYDALACAIVENALR